VRRRLQVENHRCVEIYLHARFSVKELPAMPSKAPPRIRLEQVFVRDHQRRLQLVMDVLEQEFRQQQPLETRSQMLTIDDNPLLLPVPHCPVGGEAL
jgi:hypothetical protein